MPRDRSDPTLHGAFCVYQRYRYLRYNEYNVKGTVPIEIVVFQCRVVLLSRLLQYNSCYCGSGCKYSTGFYGSVHYAARLLYHRFGAHVVSCIISMKSGLCFLSSFCCALVDSVRSCAELHLTVPSHLSAQAAC